MSAPIEVRAMTADNLPAGATVTDTVFGAQFEQDVQPARDPAALPAAAFHLAFRRRPRRLLRGRGPRRPRSTGRRAVPVARGTLGWFGPLAVAHAAQGRGVGLALVAACVGARRARGVRLMALESVA